jgi:hypothetical protein
MTPGAQLAAQLDAGTQLAQQGQNNVQVNLTIFHICMLVTF